MTRNEKQQQTGPRLIQAADLAARRAKDAEEAMARTKQKTQFARETVIRMRAPRDARDARLAFDALFGQPAA
jgi:hypothetical protein